MEGTVSPKKSGSLWENILAIFIAVILAMVIRTFWIQPFFIPSGSMIPTLLIGDNLLVSKGAYGYSRYSLPFGDKIPYFEGKTNPQEPMLGDVIVFRPPGKDDTDFVKRVVGREGDRVQLKDGILYINGIDCRLQRSDDVVVVDDDGSSLKVAQYVETLPNGRQHRIIKKVPFGQGQFDNTRVFEVPENHVFVMGDNRDGSLDSRSMTFISYVPVTHVIGRANRVLFSTGGHSKFFEFWKWWDTAQWGRTFLEVQ